MAWLDIIILLLLASSMIRGMEVGFIRQFFSALGFIVGLLTGAWFQSYVIGYMHTAASRAVIVLLLTVGMALLGMVVGEYIGMDVQNHVREGGLGHKLDKLFGAALGAVTLLAIVWLGSTMLRTLPNDAWQRLICTSRIVGVLNQILPSAPDVLTRVGYLIAPNGSPKVFSGIEPTPQTTVQTASLHSFDQAITTAQKSVVKVEGTGCGGVVQGSGFIVAKNTIITNAHVVAGVKDPKIIDSNGTHTAQVVSFDPTLDIATLRTTDLAGQPLALAGERSTKGTQLAALGYPAGSGFTVVPATVLDSYVAFGHDIYNKNDVDRQVYSLQSDIEPGNSGGPLITNDDTVAGMVFAKSGSWDNVGYALTGDQLAKTIKSIPNSIIAVDTGTCAE